MIEIKHLRKEFEDTTPLKDVNAVINSGDIIAVIGPSGTGKSTLLRCINMLETPTSGQIIVDCCPKSVCPPRRCPIRTSCPAASSSVSPSRARWPWTRRSSCSTSPPPRWTPP